MTVQTPYAAELGGREPIAALREGVDRIVALTRDWTPAQFEGTYAPGKWSARQILIHLAQTEIALGCRARMALATPGYTAQPFDQDRWIALESGSSGRSAAEALAALNTLNRALFAALSAADRARPFSHPEYGVLTVDWLVHQMAGHLLHHLKQLETIGRMLTADR
jgi:hypothetical protein